MSDIAGCCRTVSDEAKAAWSTAPDKFRHVLCEASNALLRAADEIERLRDEHQQWSRGIQPLRTRLAQREQEIEWLRAEVERMRKRNQRLLEALRKLSEEIETDNGDAK